MLNNTKTQSRPKLLFLVPAISQTHKSLENSQDSFVKTKTKTKTFTSRPRPRLWVSRPRPRLYFFVLEASRDQDFVFLYHIAVTKLNGGVKYTAWRNFPYIAKHLGNGMYHGTLTKVIGIADRSVLVSMISSDLKRRDAR